MSVRGVGPKYADAVSLMIERFIEFQALGGVIRNGNGVESKALPPGGICHHAGSPDDPDFNNVHVEVKWPAGSLS
nr:MetaGeneMark_Unknown Function [uncultured bacterium]